MNFFLNNLPHERHKDTSDICSFRTVPYMYSCRLQRSDSRIVNNIMSLTSRQFVYSCKYISHALALNRGLIICLHQMRAVAPAWYMWTPLGLADRIKAKGKKKTQTPRREGFSWSSQNRIWGKAHFEPRKQLMSPHHVTARWRTEVLKLRDISAHRKISLKSVVIYVGDHGPNL